jgi:hypothetical protein
MLKARMLLAVSAFIAAAITACDNASLGSSDLSRPLTVAFIGDQGSGDDARAVLQLIKAEGADLVLHQGDFDYEDDPDSWDALITSVLGADFPYFASIGNHDIEEFYGSDGYQAKLKIRLKKGTGAHCDGDLGVKSACTFRGSVFHPFRRRNHSRSTRRPESCRVYSGTIGSRPVHLEDLLLAQEPKDDAAR